MVPWEDQLRVFLIEPFDEWEEIHLKCVHYVLSIASQGCLTNWSNLCIERPRKGKHFVLQLFLVYLLRKEDDAEP